MANTDTRVVFRKFNEDGQVIALFPDTLHITRNGWELESYMHVGQHADASANIVEITKLATKDEYQPLLDELTGPIGYDNLRVTSKLNTRKR